MRLDRRLPGARAAGPQGPSLGSVTRPATTHRHAAWVNFITRLAYLGCTAGHPHRRWDRASPVGWSMADPSHKGVDTCRTAPGAGGPPASSSCSPSQVASSPLQLTRPPPADAGSGSRPRRRRRASARRRHTATRRAPTGRRCATCRRRARTRPPGRPSSPWRTLQHALSTITAGETLYVMGGTYTENVQISESSIHPGTADQPVKVLAYPGERPVVKGLLWLTNASYWHLDGINVTWNPSNSSEHPHGEDPRRHGWRISNAELWGARSYAGLLVSDGAEQFLVDHNFIHDTYASNDNNQDHLIYVDNGHDGSGVDRAQHPGPVAERSRGEARARRPRRLRDQQHRRAVQHLLRATAVRRTSSCPGRRATTRSTATCSTSPRAARPTSPPRAHRQQQRRARQPGVALGPAWWSWMRTASSTAGGNVHADPQLVDPDDDDFRPG